MSVLTSLCSGILIIYTSINSKINIHLPPKYWTTKRFFSRFKFLHIDITSFKVFLNTTKAVKRRVGNWENNFFLIIYNNSYLNIIVNRKKLLKDFF